MLVISNPMSAGGRGKEMLPVHGNYLTSSPAWALDGDVDMLGKKSAWRSAGRFVKRKAKKTVRVAKRTVNPKLKLRELRNFAKDPVRGVKEATVKQWDNLTDTLSDAWSLISDAAKWLFIKALRPIVTKGLKASGADTKMRSEFRKLSAGRDLSSRGVKQDISKQLANYMKRLPTKTPILSPVVTAGITAVNALNVAFPGGAAAVSTTVPALMSVIYDKIVEGVARNLVNGIMSSVASITDRDVKNSLPVTGQSGGTISQSVMPYRERFPIALREGSRSMPPAKEGSILPYVVAGAVGLLLLKG